MTTPDTQTGPPAPPDARWYQSRKVWLTLALLIVLTLVALLIDGRVAAALEDETTGKWAERISKAVLDFGVILVMLGILASFANRWRLWGGFIMTMLAATAILHLLKWGIGRARPLVEQAGPFAFRPFSGEQYFDAFPSGHTTSATTLALLLGMYFPRGRWVFYALALAVGAERVATRWHWVSDVFAGYVLAGLVVFAAVRLLGRASFRPELRIDSATA